MKENKGISIGLRLRSKRTIFSFLIAILVLYFLLTMVDLSKTINLVMNANLGYFFVAFAIYYLSVPIRGYRWMLLLENVDFKGRFRDVTEIWFLAYFVNCLLPAKLGDVYRGYLIRKNYKLSISRVMGTIVVERMIELIFLILLLSLSGYFVFGSVLPSNIFSIVISGYFFVFLALTFLVFLYIRKERVVSLLPSRFGSMVLEFVSGLSKSLRVKSLSGVLVLTALGWMAEIFRLYFVALSLNLSITFSLVVFIALLVSILSSVPLTPTGFGVVELVVGSILVFFGYSIEVSASVAILDRVINTFSFMAIGPFIYFKSDLK